MRISDWSSDVCSSDLAVFDDAVKAGQDRERQINEGQAYANQVVPLAGGQASRMLEQAEGYKAKVIGDARGDAARFTSILAEYEKAPKIMRERMYLETKIGREHV